MDDLFRIRMCDGGEAVKNGNTSTLCSFCSGGKCIQFQACEVPDPADPPLDTPAAAADRTYAAWMALCALAAVACWAIAIYRFTH